MSLHQSKRSQSVPTLNPEPAEPKKGKNEDRTWAQAYFKLKKIQKA